MRELIAIGFMIFSVSCKHNHEKTSEGIAPKENYKYEVVDFTKILNERSLDYLIDYFGGNQSDASISKYTIPSLASNFLLFEEDIESDKCENDLSHRLISQSESSLDVTFRQWMESYTPKNLKWTTKSSRVSEGVKKIYLSEVYDGLLYGELRLIGSREYEDPYENFYQGEVLAFLFDLNNIESDCIAFKLTLNYD